MSGIPFPDTLKLFPRCLGTSRRSLSSWPRRGSPDPQTRYRPYPAASGRGYCLSGSHRCCASDFPVWPGRLIHDPGARPRAPPYLRGSGGSGLREGRVGILGLMTFSRFTGFLFPLADDAQNWHPEPIAARHEKRQASVALSAPLQSGDAGRQ